MDLGTANTIIISNGKIVVDEPSVVALDRRTDKMIAVGEKAKMMYEKTHVIVLPPVPEKPLLYTLPVHPSTIHVCVCSHMLFPHTDK